MIAKLKVTVLAAAASLCLGLPTMAQKAEAAILLNFGATVSDDNNSPAHVHGGVTGTTWNLINKAVGLSSGVVTDTGAATNLSVAVGINTGDSVSTMDWGATSGFSFAALGSQINTGVYAGNAKSAMYGGGGYAVGVRVSGLEPGIYDVYQAGRNTNNTSQQSYQGIVFTIDASEGTTTNYDDSAGVVMDNTLRTDAWVEGDNFLVTTVEIEADQDLVLVHYGSQERGRGFLGIMEIVPVPEPTGVALFGLGGMALALRRRRSA